MTETHAVDRDRSLFFTTQRQEPKGHTVFLEALNQAETVVSADFPPVEKQAALQRIYSHAEKLLDEFLADEAALANSRRPARWLAPILRAMLTSARGDAGAALGHGQQALAAAEELRDEELTAIALSNLTEYTSVLEQYDLGAEYARRALRSRWTNSGILVTCAKALYKAGDKTAAERALARAAEFLSDDPRSIIRAHGEYEHDLSLMADLPSARAIVEHAADSREKGGV